MDKCYEILTITLTVLGGGMLRGTLDHEVKASVDGTIVLTKDHRKPPAFYHGDVM